MTQHRQWKSVDHLIGDVKTKLQGQDRLSCLFETCYANTLHTTVRELSDGTTYVITGDIPAMWLRDSAAQMRPYLIPAREDEALAELIAGLVRRQFFYIDIDPYTNAWSGFRPSDDACTYGYLIPSNMFAAVALRYLEEIAEMVYHNEQMREEASCLRQQIEEGIARYGIVETETYGKIYAYEVDGFGQYNLMDDANIPSLLSLPYLGYPGDTAVWQNTRRFILSEANPYFYQGKFACGIGSPHTPANHVWHLSLIMQGMTSTDQREKEDILRMLTETDAGTGLMHESVHVDDPKKYTRKWFSWANALFCEWILDFCGYKIGR